MKAKQWLSVLALGLMVLTTQVSCDSKRENKAEEVQDQQEDLNEARADGDTSDIREERQELDSAKADYNSAVKKERRN